MPSRFNLKSLKKDLDNMGQPQHLLCLFLDFLTSIQPGSHHSSLVLSPPTILQPRVRISRRPSKLFSNLFYWNCNEKRPKRGRDWPILLKNINTNIFSTNQWWENYPFRFRRWPLNSHPLNNDASVIASTQINGRFIYTLWL